MIERRAATADLLARWACPSCGEEAVARDAAWVERAAALHRCPPDEVERALKGEYDG